MTRLSLTKLAAAAGGVAFALTAGSGIASADPLDPIINSTCNYEQVMAALNATDPAAAAQVNGAPMVQGYLRQFIASSPPQRLQIARQVQAMPSAAPYFNDIMSVANICNNY
jgi:hemophore-related protein